MNPRVLACITFHYIPGRMVWLGQVLACFRRYGAAVRVIIFTNTADPVELAEIDALSPTGGAARVERRSVNGLIHPFELTWAHKDTIANEFLAGSDTHFVYVEDDIAIAPEAFAYWIEHRTPLARHGLIPAFLRVERERASDTVYATDQMHPTQLDRIRMVRVGPWTFTNLDNPYTGTFILDRDLAAEYVASRSFTLGASKAVKPNWGVRERAAMGLCFERIPRFFWSRLVVPFDRTTLRVPEFAQIVHLPANYANDPASDLAKIPAAGMLLKPSVRLFMRERGRTARRVLQSWAR